MKQRRPKSSPSSSQGRNIKAAILSQPIHCVGLKFLILSHLLIIALGLTVYFNSLHGQFVYDDLSVIRDNVLIKHPSEIFQCFTQGLFAGASKGSAFYRPLQMASYVINYAFCKQDVIAYHATNLFFHLLAALGVFWFIFTLIKNERLSLIAAALFVVHPVQTEAVSYISGRCDPMALTFMLACLIVYIQGIDHKHFHVGRYLLLIFCYTAALFSKEHSLILPVLIVLYHVVLGKKIKVLEFSTIVGLALAYIFLRLNVLQSLIPASSTDTFFDRLPGFFVAFLTYIKLLFIPYPLHMEYGQKLFAWTDLRAIGGLCLMTALCLGAYRSRSNKILIFALGWFLFALLPVANLYKINFYMAEHFLYIPSVGFFLGIAYFLDALLENKNYRIIGFAIIFTAVIAFSILTIKQNRYWHDPLTFYRMTLKYVTDSSNAENNMGNIYYHQGKYDEAFVYYKRAVDLNPNSEEALNNLGLVYSAKGEDSEAIMNLSKALIINPQYADVYNNRGKVYAHDGEDDLALEDFAQALSLKADFPEVYINRGNFYITHNQYDQALSDFTKAKELKPDEPEVYDGLGRVYSGQLKFDAAIDVFDQALKLNASYADAYNHRGFAYEAKGNVKQAIADYSKAIELSPDYADPYSSRGRAYGKIKNFESAIKDFDRAIKLDPKFLPTYTNRAVAYFFLKEYDKAWADVHKAQALGGDVSPQFIAGLKQASGIDP